MIIGRFALPLLKSSQLCISIMEKKIGIGLEGRFLTCMWEYIYQVNGSLIQQHTSFMVVDALLVPKLPTSRTFEKKSKIKLDKFRST
jgi:hypothetical protein